MSNGWYYLHENGDIIYKAVEPESDSTFVKRVWECRPKDRRDAWKVVLEALALGGSIERIKELTQKWGLDFKDSIQMLRRVDNPTPEMKQGLHKFATDILGMDWDVYWGMVELEARKESVSVFAE